MARDKRVAISLTDEEKQALRVRAAKEDMAMAEFVRELVLRELARDDAADQDAEGERSGDGSGNRLIAAN